MINIKKYYYAFIVFGITLCGTTIANDTTHLGADHSRKELSNKAGDSSSILEKKYSELLDLIKKSHLTGDDEHITETVNVLIADQNIWLSYRNTHCQLQANVYVYPSGSRMWASEFNSCMLKMNNARVKFLNDISDEYNK